ncbi:MAG: glyoxalase superfamily protein [Pseudomonadota bacterium]
MFRSVTPVIRTGNYAKARGFYADILGFSCTEEAGAPPVFGIFKRDGIEIFLDGQNGADAPHNHWRAYFTVEDAEALSQDIRDAGGILSKDLHTTVYGMREFELTDPDGNVICFGADV